MENPLQKYLAFVTTVETGSFTRAAAKLRCAQSSVSKMIADLERDWGVALLERGRGGVCLTSSGQQLLPRVRALLRGYQELEEQVQQMHGVQTGVVRVGTFASAAIHWLPNIVSAFQKDYPGIDYELLLGDYDEVERWIEDGRVDCGILRTPKNAALDKILLKNDEYKLVLPVGHPLAALDAVPVEALNDEPFLLLERGGKTEVSDLLERSGVHPKIRFTTWEDFAIMAMAEKGMGVGILPDLILRRVAYRIAVRPLQTPYYRPIYLAMKNRARLTPAVQKFLDYLKFRESGENGGTSDE